MEGYPWWTEAQIQLSQQARKVVDSLIPLATEYGWRKKFPRPIMKDLGIRGWFGALVPKEYGGRLEDWGVTGACILCEEASRAGQLVAQPLITTMIGGTHQIMHEGTREQKQRWLPRISSGQCMGAITLTEPFVGSDAAGVETSAKREGDVYIINGKKRFITNSLAADIYMTYVRSSEQPEDRASYRHLNALVIEKGTPGFTVEKVNELVGFDGVYNSYLNFLNARVPVANRLGEEGDGWKVMTSGLNVERTIAAAANLGGMQEAIRYAVYHMQRRVQFGQPTINLPTNQFKVADLIWQFQVTRLVTYYTAYLFDLGKDAPLESAIAKLFGSETSAQHALEAIQCMGGDGCTRFYPVERNLRDVKISQVAAGTNEVMKLIIFRQGLKDMAEDLKVPQRAIHPELNVPIPVPDQDARPVQDEKDVLRALAEFYRVSPGLHMSMAELKGVLLGSDKELAALLESLEKKGLARLYKDKKGAIALARATYEGLSQANPPEYYRYIPSWVSPEDVF